MLCVQLKIARNEDSNVNKSTQSERWTSFFYIDLVDLNVKAVNEMTTKYEEIRITYRTHVIIHFYEQQTSATQEPTPTRSSSTATSAHHFRQSSLLSSFWITS